MRRDFRPTNRKVYIGEGDNLFRQISCLIEKKHREVIEVTKVVITDITNLANKLNLKTTILDPEAPIVVLGPPKTKPTSKPMSDGTPTEPI